jgi:hypothetical protein
MVNPAIDQPKRTIRVFQMVGDKMFGQMRRKRHKKYQRPDTWKDVLLVFSILAAVQLLFVYFFCFVLK